MRALTPHGQQWPPPFPLFRWTGRIFRPALFLCPARRAVARHEPFPGTWPSVVSCHRTAASRASGTGRTVAPASGYTADRPERGSERGMCGALAVSSSSRRAVRAAARLRAEPDGALMEDRRAGGARRTGGAVGWPGNLVPPRLPPYSPESNPTEQVFRRPRRAPTSRMYADAAELEAALTASPHRLPSALKKASPAGGCQPAQTDLTMVYGASAGEPI